MTPQEQQASDVMHRELGVKCAADKACAGMTDDQRIEWLRTHNSNTGQPIETPSQTDIGGGVIATFRRGSISLNGEIVLTWEMLADLNKFAESIGWQCD